MLGTSLEKEVESFVVERILPVSSKLKFWSRLWACGDILRSNYGNETSRSSSRARFVYRKNL